MKNKVDIPLEISGGEKTILINALEDSIRLLGNALQLHSYNDVNWNKSAIRTIQDKIQDRLKLIDKINNR